MILRRWGVRDMPSPEEVLYDKFEQVRQRLGQPDDPAVDQMIYRELRSNVSDDAGIIAFRVMVLIGLQRQTAAGLLVSDAAA
jgi:hypothetical protein